jgi:hypothetical protein
MSVYAHVCACMCIYSEGIVIMCRYIRICMYMLVCAGMQVYVLYVHVYAGILGVFRYVVQLSLVRHTQRGLVVAERTLLILSASLVTSVSLRWRPGPPADRSKTGPI